MSLIIFNFAGSNPTINNYKTMKRTILLLLSVMMTVIMTAGDVTPQQALQQAQKFLQQTPSGMKRSQAEVPQLKMAGRVSGLYVFNAEQNQGYVIVSNDDRTTPILGYSETGTLDPDNMPCNMRAWLQGYADEIAWLNEHNVQPTTAPVARRAAVKTPIAPLVQTHWNQNSPYNNNCPYYKKSGSSYSYSLEGGEGYEHCATGCVATAMAQVMYYHKWPTAATTAIPAYTWKEYSLSLPATTFDWANMLNEYTKDNSAGETAAQMSAVAKLMQYCGVSVQMDYGPESGSNTDKVVAALKNYFGYNATTQIVVRSLYTYTEWIELIYNELNQGRPVVYGGQSSGGGHEFVCDGYQGEDYFHINWGWGGMSDNYFKLSALDSDQQGIGGSSSSDGYHYGQDAAIGIQKSTESGTVLDITAHNPNLTLNSISGPETAVAGQEVTFTVNVKNEASQDYSGDIWLAYNNSGWILFAGDAFNIAAGETKDCAIKATFNVIGTDIEVAPFIPKSDGYYYKLGSETTSVNVTADGSGTDNVVLTLTPTVEHAEYSGSDSKYNLYGNIFKATIRLNNGTETDYSGRLYWKLLPGSFSGNFSYESKDVSVSKGSNVDVPLETSVLDWGETSYRLLLSYRYNGSLVERQVFTYTLKSAYIAYKKDGTKTVTKPTSTSYAVDDDVLCVDLSGTGVETVTLNSEPNCIYLLKSTDEVPDGLTNVVKYNAGTYTAANITLTDGNDFYSPIDFTAANIVFNYAFTKGADGTGGWNTIMLPYNVTSVTADDVAIKWFQDDSDTGKQFWVKEFVSDEPGVVNFDYVKGTTMNANTPYIVAFPGDHWGPTYDLSGKTIKFIGQDVTIHKNGEMQSVTGSNYRFIGNTMTDTTPNVYTINAAGNKFVAGSGSAPFRAYFKPGIFDPTLTSLGIGNGGGTTGIETMSEVRGVMSDVWYDLQGRRVENPTKGVYIKNGRKVVIK